MGVSDFLWKYGVDAVLGIDSFGESALAPVLFKHFGFMPDNVAATVGGEGRVEEEVHFIARLAVAHLINGHASAIFCFTWEVRALLPRVFLKHQGGARRFSCR